MVRSIFSEMQDRVESDMSSDAEEEVKKMCQLTRDMVNVRCDLGFIKHLLPKTWKDNIDHNCKEIKGTVSYSLNFEMYHCHCLECKCTPVIPDAIFSVANLHFITKTVLVIKLWILSLFESMYNIQILSRTILILVNFLIFWNISGYTTIAKKMSINLLLNLILDL